MENKKLYVGNLPYSATEDQMREMFAQAGTVQSVAIITDKESGRSKGFGFVEMADSDSSQKAINQFNGYDYGGRKITVNEARPREERPAGGGGRDRRY
jgi:RNA recognition motif-containing protein